MNEGETKGQDQLITNLKARLHWYAYECSPEEFNEKEVRTIVDLLNQLDPVEPEEYFNAEKGLERFWNYYENKLEEDKVFRLHMEKRPKRKKDGLDSAAEDMETAEDMDVMEALEAAKRHEAEIAAFGSVSEGGTDGKIVRITESERTKKSKLGFFKRHKAMTGTVTAAALVLMFTVCGTFGAYAEKDTGFFHWISKDKTGVEIIISPESGDLNAGVDGTQRYNSLEDVPEDIRNELWLPNEMPEELTLQYIDTLSTSGWERIIGAYKNDNDIHLDIGIKTFANDIVFHRQSFADYDYLYAKNIEEINMEFFIKDSDDETEYAVCFYGETEQYSIQGNLSQDEIMGLAVNYSKYILEK